MKKYRFILLALVLSIVFACKEDKIRNDETWSSSVIEVDKVTPINGGATITYNIPDDPGLLYIMAEYERNGKVFTEKSSIYKNTLTIEGFNTTGKVPVKLYKVNKQGQKSEPLALEFVPLESPIEIAHKSLSIVPGFGGVIAGWKNPSTTELGVRLMVKDGDDALTTEEMYYSSIKDERHTFRGFDSKETTFAIAFEDKWGNISDTTTYTTTPFFETMVPKPYVDFRASIPYDNKSTLAGYTIASLWDNKVNTLRHGWLTQAGNSGLSMTIDLKQVVKLSRIVIHGYTENSPYTQANFTQFEVWGVRAIDYAKLSDLPYWLDEYSVRINAIHGVNSTTVLPSKTFKDDWQYLGWHAIPRYDRMVPPDPQAQLNLAKNGAEYEVPLDAAPVRYIRIYVRELMGVMPPPADNYFSMGEITIYGDTKVPQ